MKYQCQTITTHTPPQPTYDAPVTLPPTANSNYNSIWLRTYVVAQRNWQMNPGTVDALLSLERHISDIVKQITYIWPCVGRVEAHRGDTVGPMSTMEIQKGGSHNLQYILCTTGNIIDMVHGHGASMQAWGYLGMALTHHWRWIQMSTWLGW